MNAPNYAKNENIVWVDMEMTGLNYKTDHILEIACIVTDKNLNVLGEGLDLIINQSKEVLDGMNDWCLKHHGDVSFTSV